MFGNKKNRTVPPRPQPPLAQQILEDLKSSNNHDVAFNILNNEIVELEAAVHERSPSKFFAEKTGDDLHFPTNANDPVNVYRKVKTYLDVNNKLKTLDESLCEKVEGLKDIENEILILAKEIKGQANTALAE